MVFQRRPGRVQQSYRSHPHSPDTILRVHPRRPASPSSARFYRCAVLAGAVACAACRPDAATTNRRAPGDEFDPTVVLQGRSADAAEGAMAGAAAGHAARPLAAAADGVRWSDVELAMTNVARRSFVGVEAYDRTENAVVATTILADGQRGTVIASRDALGAISFRARLGTLADDRRDRAFELDAAKELRRLGAIPRPQA